MRLQSFFRKFHRILFDASKNSILASIAWASKLCPCLLALVLIASAAHAQDIGVVAPRTLVVKAFDAHACAVGTFIVPDRGLNSHFVLYDTSAGITGIAMRIEGSFDGITYIPIIYSDDTELGHGGMYSSIYAPFIRVRIVSCVGAGTITAWYSGTWSQQPLTLALNGLTQFPCTLEAVISFTGAGDHQIVPTGGDPLKSIHICDLSFGLSAASNVTFLDGTGANCVTGPSNRTGPYQNILSFVWQFSYFADFTVRPGRNLCVNTGAVTGGGWVKYAEF